MSVSLPVALGRAEESLRARGLTGGQAFDELVSGMKARLGLAPPHRGPGTEAAADLPLEAGHDLVGLAYERFFPDLFKGRHGQYFTPAPIVRLLFSRLPVHPGDVVVDPACGSGALLAEAATRGARVVGFDVDPRLVELARLGLRLRGADAVVERGDLFAMTPTPADVLVANPPFSVRISDPAVLSRFETARRRDAMLSDQLFVEAMERFVRPGGHAGIVLPWSVLVNPSFASVRRRIDEHWHKRAIVALPEGVFRPFGGAAGRAAVLVLERRVASSHDVRPPSQWAEIVDPGYDVRRKQVRLTSSPEIDRLVAGQGWQALPSGAWSPPVEATDRSDVVEVATLAEARPSVTLEGPEWVVDLGDVVRRTGEVLPRRVERAPASRRQALNDGDVLVARMRPNLGNVAWLPDLPGVCGGSPEWIALSANEAPGYLWHALRTPTWRAQLPLTAGQTRPRTDVATVLASTIRWPGMRLARRVHALSERLERRRAEIRRALDDVQDAVDAFAAGEIDAAELGRRVDAIEPDDTSARGR